jgi:UDP-N-acetylmuramate dehydrogenase
VRLLAARKLTRLLSDRAEFNIPFSGLTTWKVGGPAWCLCRLHSREEAKAALAILADSGVPFMVLGNGSNLLVSDLGYEGAVLKLEGRLAALEVKNDLISAGGGVLLGQALRESAQAGLSGLEWAAAIPASLGGAIAMNAGSMGQNIGSVLERVDLLLSNGDVVTLERDSLPPFAYRKSNLPPASIVLGAKLKLRPGSAWSVRRNIAANTRLKRQRFPFNYPNAGSVFMNPEGDYAGRLIESAGLKGKRWGNAQISDVHGNFIVNMGAAKADDIYRLIVMARDTVKEKFGISLDLEIKLIGYVEPET